MVARRHTAEVAANDASRLLNDPAFKTAIQRVNDEITRKIRTLDHDGSGEKDAEERELCRELRVLDRLVSKIAAPVQLQALKEHNEKNPYDHNGKRK